MSRELVSDELWGAVEPLIPPARPKLRGGRPRVPDRVALRGIIFVLRTGIPWEYLPKQFGCSGMTCWRRLRDWAKAGVWHRLHAVLLERLEATGKLDWSRASLDSASIPAKGGAAPTRTSARILRIGASPVPSATSWSTATACPSPSG
jgi:transposase